MIKGWRLGPGITDENRVCDENSVYVQRSLIFSLVIAAVAALAGGIASIAGLESDGECHGAPHFVNRNPR